MIAKELLPIRTDVIRYMCELNDRDLRLAGTKNTTELMYEAFKDFNPMLLSYEQITKDVKTTKTAANDSQQQQQQQKFYLFQIDKDGLDLAYKYFMCLTLTIRLCGINQMNVRTKSFSISYYMGILNLLSNFSNK